jgi:acyl-CoA thioesterase-1
MRSLLIALALGMSVGISPLFASEPSPAPQQKTLIFLGDSLTAGYGVNPEDAYPTLIAKKIKEAGFHYKIINAGSSGDTTAAGLRRLPWLLKQKPQYLIIALGANDMLRGIPTEMTEKNLTQIINEIKRAGGKPLLFGMKATPNLGADFQRKFDGIFPKLASSEHIPYLPFFISDVATKPSLNQGDSIHPNAAGHRAVADKVWKFLQPLLEKP